MYFFGTRPVQFWFCWLGWRSRVSAPSSTCDHSAGTQCSFVFSWSAYQWGENMLIYSFFREVCVTGSMCDCAVAILPCVEFVCTHDGNFKSTSCFNLSLGLCERMCFCCSQETTWGSQPISRSSKCWQLVGLWVQWELRHFRHRKLHLFSLRKTNLIWFVC